MRFARKNIEIRASHICLEIEKEHKKIFIKK